MSKSNEPAVNFADEITLERLSALVRDIDPVPAAVIEAARDAFIWVWRGATDYRRPMYQDSE